MDILNLPKEGEMSRAILGKLLKEKFPIVQDNPITAIRPPNKSQIAHIFTDKSSFSNYIVLLSIYKKFNTGLMFHPFRYESYAIYSSSFVSHNIYVGYKKGVLGLPIRDKRYLKEVENLFLIYLKEQPIIEYTPNVILNCDYDKVPYSQQLSFLSKFLGELYESLFLFN